jgi:hypothetical protein
MEEGILCVKKNVLQTFVVTQDWIYPVRNKIWEYSLSNENPLSDEKGVS